MPAHRFFLNDDLSRTTALLSGPEIHHLKHVMRVQIGQQVELVNGKGTLAKARLTEVKTTEAYFDIIEKIDIPSPPFELILAQAITRPALLDWIIEKGTELGATQFWLFPGDLSEKKELTSHQLERLQHLMVGALKQCGRLYLPTLTMKPSLSQWAQPSETVLFGSLLPTAQPLASHYASSVVIVVGPEKGFSAEEHRTLETQIKATGIKLHSNILRAETAALCALSLLSYRQLSSEDRGLQPAHL